jgi:DNA-dependent RNA polymerase auxiliary subunit epsilon
MSIDSGFFGKKVIFANGEERERIDVCTVMPEVVYKPKPEPGKKKAEPETKSKPVRELIERIIVPKEALEKARTVAEKNHFEPACVVDFVSAMELAALEAEYEAVKNQRRIRLIRSAQAWAV